MHEMQLSLFLQTVIIAFCSMIYEFVLAQTMSAIIGGTVIQYSITIGLFMASLGFGAMAVGFVSVKEKQLTLIRIEIFLAILGALAPIIILKLHNLSLYVNPAFETITVLSSYFIIILIGFLSGFELPLLIKIAADYGLKSRLILISDYIGMFLATLLFPIYLLVELGTFGTAWFASLLNASVALYLIKSSKNIIDVRKNKLHEIIAVGIIAALTGTLFFNRFLSLKLGALF